MAIPRPFYVYIMANRKNGTLYIGITNNLINRAYQHKNSILPGFTTKYKTNKLVYYEVIFGALEAIAREKQLKKWNRAWKIKLIEKENPLWLDLFSEILQA